MTFLKKTNFGKWVSVIPGKKIQTTFQVWIYFPEMTLTHFPKNIFFKNSWPYIQEKSLDFFPEMTLTHFPKSDFWNFGWIFFQEWRLLISRLLDFFFQDSRIGVNMIRKKIINFGVDKLGHENVASRPDGTTPSRYNRTYLN